MTRPKVPDDKRQRTAQACDSCKRRKQKCNGLKPCNTCVKRSLICSYSPGNGSDYGPSDSASSPVKRRHIDTSPVDTKPDSESSARSQTTPADAPASETAPATAWKQAPSKALNLPPAVKIEAEAARLNDRLDHDRNLSDLDYDSHSRVSAVSGPDEEAVVYSSTRMLQDSTGRLLYVGDSATLSYLQLIRMIVESTAGASPFTLDPRRHRIMEHTVTLPPYLRPPNILPDRQTADVLIESFFTNTSGLLEVFSRRSFMSSVESCYSDPLSVDSSFLCLLYLTFAIGLVHATPMPGSRDDAVIKRLRADQLDRAEMFFRSAKCLGDPVSGFEDADFWSVQALLLMSVYMLAISKRNAAYAYYGMAVRSAFALGLHREETMVIFSAEELAVRRNLWRSLFVLDRFLAASLGRPTAISEDDCSADALKSPEKSLPPGSLSTSSTSNLSNGLNAAVQSCRVIGVILKKVYSKRKISTRVAQEIADQCKSWPQKLNDNLHWRQAGNGLNNSVQGITILHVNLLYCHSVILLTRPFFLYLINKVLQDRGPGTRQPTRIGTRMEKFSEACVMASYHTIVLVQIAFDSNYLPQRNPFVLYFLFAATLIVLSNEFASLYHDPQYAECISDAISIMSYCAQSDPQAERLLYILTTFRTVVMNRTQSSLGTAARSLPIISASPQSSYDPVASFFSSHDVLASSNRSSGPPTQGLYTGPPKMPRGGSLPSPTLQHQRPVGSVKPAQQFPSSNTTPKPEAGMSIAAVSPASTTGPTPGPPVRLHGGGSSTAEGDGSESFGADAEFDFDTLWNWSSGGGAGQSGPDIRTGDIGMAGTAGPANTAMPAPGSVVGAERFDTYGTGFGVPGPNGAAPGSMPGLINVPLYPTSDFG